MKTNSFTALLNVCFVAFILSPNQIFGQYIPGIDAFEAEDTVCIWDPSVEFTTTKSFTAYQTIDDTFNVPIDANFCVSLRYEEDFSGMSFHSHDFDLSRSIYLRADFDTNALIPLQPDAVYQLAENFLSSIPELFRDPGCPDLMCSGLILGITIPDSTLTADTTRWLFFSSDLYSPEMCYTTEKFEGQKINAFIYKLTFDEGFFDVLRNFYPLFQMQMFDVTTITDMNNIDGNFIGGLFISHAYEFMNTQIGVLKYDEPTYPSTSNFDYIDVSPEPNPDEPVTIQLIIDEFNTLLAQPYVQLRGAQAAVDTSRHEVQLVNDGGIFCVSIAEIIFDGNTHYIFKKGKMDLYSPMSCLMFRNGASIQVADNGHLAYGKNGIGVLGLGSGGTIKIGKNASLTINNRISIIKNPNSVYSGDIYMNLNKGSNLIFGQGASISNDEKSLNGGHLCIYMNGGELDMSGLDDFSQELIRLIYPEEEKTMSANMHIYPNPVQNSFTIEIVAAESSIGDIQISGLNGAVVFTKKYELDAGINAIKIQIPDLQPGAYSIQCKTNTESGSNSFVKL